MKRALCIDIDNVVAQTDLVLREVIRLHSRNGVDLRYEDVVEFDYWLCKDAGGRCFDKSEWWKIHDEEFTQNHLLRIRPVDNIMHHLEQLRGRYELHLVTSRRPEGEAHTRQWIREYGIPHDYLHFSSHRAKHKLPVPFFAAVDDDREQIRLFHEAGVLGFILAHPWNKVDVGCSLRRVDDWQQLTAELLKLAA